MIKETITKVIQDRISAAYYTPQAVAAALSLLDFGIQLHELEDVVGSWSTQIPIEFRIEVIKQFEAIQASLHA